MFERSWQSRSKPHQFDSNLFLMKIVLKKILFVLFCFHSLFILCIFLPTIIQFNEQGNCVFFRFHCICCNVCLQCINLFSKLETVFLGNSLDPATRPVARCSLRCCMTTQCRPPHPVWLTCPQPRLKMYFSQIAKCICLK